MYVNKKVLSRLFIIALVSCFLACQEDENSMRSIITLDAEVVNNSVVLLKALPKSSNFEECGIVWDALPGPDYEDNVFRFFVFQPNIEITAELRNLDMETTYYFRSYSKIGDKIEYGEEKSFVFGGFSPQIERLSPNTAHLGDTILIVGKNFSPISSRMLIQFESLISTIVYASSDTVKCIVPKNLPPESHPVVLKLGNKSTAPILFTLHKPEIIDFSPKSATYLDLIVIEGNNFNKIKSSNKVMFGAVVGEVTAASQSSLTVKVPVQLAENLINITVQVDSQRVEAVGNFSLKTMTVNGINPSSERIGNIVTISGSNFNPSTNYNDVYFDGNKAEVIEASSDILKVIVPNGIYKDYNLNISIKVGSVEEDSFPFTIKNAWIRRADIPAGIFGRLGGQGFTIGGIGYAGLGAGAVSSAYQDFYKFDDVNNSWTRIADYGGGKRYWTTGFVIDNIAYVGTGSATTLGEGTKDFYKYDPQSNSWSRIADFTGGPTTKAIGFSINGKGYLCLPNLEDNFWEYDPALNVWTKKSTLVTSPWGGSKKAVGAFVLNNRAFVLTSLYSIGELYEYDLINDTWIRKNDLAGTSNLPALVSTDSHAYYMVDYTMKEYNLNTDSWQDVDFEPVPTRNDVFFYSIENKIFIGGGRENSYKDFWQCDTSKF